MTGPAEEHLEITKKAAVDVKEKVPTEDFSHQIWLDFEKLVKDLEQGMGLLHPAVHEAADAHEKHVEKTAKHIEVRTAAVQKASDNVAHHEQASADAHASVSVAADTHAEGSPEHADAVAKHDEAKANHEQAKVDHEESKQHLERAHEKHEHAKHRHEHAKHNREKVNESKLILEELRKVLDELLTVTAQLSGEESHEHRHAVKREHQPKIDMIRGHTERVHAPLHEMHPHAVDPPHHDVEIEIEI